MIGNVAKVEERYEKLQNLEDTAGKIMSFPVELFYSLYMLM